MTVSHLIAVLLALGCGVALGMIGLLVIQTFSRLEAQDNTAPWDQGK